MKKYSITVTETCNKEYIVEANNEQEAAELFANWVDCHQEWVADDLLNSSCGWEYSKPIRMKNTTYVDLTHRELMENG